MTTPHGDDTPGQHPGNDDAPDGEPQGPDDASEQEDGPDRTDPHEHDRSTELAELGPPHGGPHPPRRTGVFLDPEDLRDHVSKLVRATLGGHEVDAFGNITFTHDDARVFITVAGSPVGPQVGVFSVTNVDLELNPDLAAFLVTTNHTLGFGAFSYDPGNQAVWLRHTLLGSTLDLPELQTAVIAIATTAARLDHEIRDRFGGRTFQEAPSEVQRRVEPPDRDDGSTRPNARGSL